MKTKVVIISRSLLSAYSAREAALPPAARITLAVSGRKTNALEISANASGS